METLMTAFVVVAAVAIVVQMGILAAMLAAMKKTSARMNALADMVEQRAMPVVDSARTLLAENGPKIQIVMDNAVAASHTARQQIERMDTTVTDVVDRARMQIVRADELVSRTMDKVEQTTDLVEQTVVQPVKQIAGIVSGVTATANALLGFRKRRRGPRNGGGPDDEMFI
jgi:ElaB/YqjD/DUF883 family membrane-anchored ribosome-binding protein